MPKVGGYHMSYGASKAPRKPKAKASRKPFGFGKKVAKGGKGVPGNFGSP